MISTLRALALWFLLCCPVLAGPMLVGCPAGGNDGNTLALIQMNGANGAGSFTDSSINARTVTAVSGTTTTTSTSKFFDSSGTFSGSSQYLTMPDSASWVIGTGDATIEAFIRVTSLADNRAIASQFTDGNTGFRFLVTTTGATQFSLYSGGVDVVASVSAAGQVSINTWYHIAMVKSGSTWRVYLNGVQISTSTAAVSWGDYASAFAVGIELVPGLGLFKPWAGQMQGFRFSNVARYTAAFTSPSYPYC